MDFADAFARYIPSTLNAESVKASEPTGREVDPNISEVSGDDMVDTFKNEQRPTERGTSDTLTPSTRNAGVVRDDGNVAPPPDMESYVL
jgi:hypothetical protein